MYAHVLRRKAVISPSRLPFSSLLAGLRGFVVLVLLFSQVLAARARWPCELGPGLRQIDPDSDGWISPGAILSRENSCQSASLQSDPGAPLRQYFAVIFLIPFITLVTSSLCEDVHFPREAKLWK